MIFTTAHRRNTHLACHRHSDAYLSVVVHGEYDEASVDGRYRLRTGDIVYHPAHHRHTNAFGSGNAVVANLPLDLRDPPPYGAARALKHSSFVLSLMRNDPGRLGEVVGDLLGKKPVSPIDVPAWLAALAEQLSDVNDHETVGSACRRLGISAEHASRRFKDFFGVAPQEYRREYRLRAAVTALASGVAPSQAALQAGFSDQSHLGRTMKRALNQTPGTYRTPEVSR